MVAMNNLVISSEAEIAHLGKGVVSDMREMFWDEETQNDLALSPLHQAVLSPSPLEESQVQLLSAYLDAQDVMGKTPLM
jgi:hypothetical protein